MNPGVHGAAWWFVVVGALAFCAPSTLAQTAWVPDGDGPALLSCSPAPCVLPPTQVSLGANQVTSAPIVADPSNPRNILVGSDDYNCGHRGVESVGFFISRNGGSYWNQVCMSYRTFHGDEYGVFPPPILGYDRHGVAYIGAGYGSATGLFSVEGFEKSSDGIHWSTPVPAIVATNSAPAYCWMTVDTNPASPYVDSVYVSCVMFVPETGINQVVVSHSNDGGARWQVVPVGPRQKAPVSNQYTNMTVGRDGTVYLAWMICDTDTDCGNSPIYMQLSTSNDGGNTWSKPRVFARAETVFPVPNTEGLFVPDGPVIGVDNSDGPHAGSLYAVMYNWTGTFMQVVVVRSRDGGQTWSKPVAVAPGITHDQFFPWLSVSPSGLVGVSWLDRRNDPANVEYQAFAAISSDGGLTFQPNVQLTQGFSDTNRLFGEYTGNTWDGPNYFLAAWMDLSNGVHLQDFVGGIRLK